MRPPRSIPLESNRGPERGVSPVVGVVLMVAVTVLLAGVVGVMLTDGADPDVAPTTDTAVSLDPTAAGTELTTEHSGGQEIDVQLRGETIATIDSDATGTTIFLPTAPGDDVYLVAGDDDADVLARETFEAGEAGDFVTYYPFDADGSDLRDRSRHGNHGEFEGGAPDWGEDEQGTYREFDGSSQSVNVPDLETGDVSVEAFTVASTFQLDDTSGVQQIVEHDAGGDEWHIETDGDDVRFAVDFGAGENAETTSGPISTGETHTVVGTYDGNEYSLYLDGAKVDSGSHEVEVNMGRMRIGADDSGDGQYLDGRLYEFRLYHTALDDHQVEMLTRVMN